MRRRKPEEDPVGATADAATEGTRPSELIVRGLLTLVLLGLIGWILLSSVGDIEEVWEALKGVSTEAGILLVALLLVVQLLIALQLALTVRGLGMRRALVAVEGAAAVSNTVPGPSGTATRLGILRSWGYYTEEFARSWLFTSSLTNFAVVTMPIVGVLVAVAIGDVTTGLLVVGLIALAVSVAAVVLVWLMVRRETFAYKVGAFTGRFVRWLQGITRRDPSERDFAEAAVGFRGGLLELWSKNGGRIVLAVLAVYIGNGVILAVSVRAVGLDTDAVPVGAVAVVYTVVRLLTIVNITPGGVGVVEALYTAAFLIVTDGANESQIVAAVLLFRGLTYVGPILLGAIALLVWRLRKSWRVPAPAESGGTAAVGTTLAGRRPTDD